MALGRFTVSTFEVFGDVHYRRLRRGLYIRPPCGPIFINAYCSGEDDTVKSKSIYTSLLMYIYFIRPRIRLHTPYVNIRPQLPSL